MLSGGERSVRPRPRGSCGCLGRGSGQSPDCGLRRTAGDESCRRQVAAHSGFFPPRSGDAHSLIVGSPVEGRYAKFAARRDFRNPIWGNWGPKSVRSGSRRTSQGGLGGSSPQGLAGCQPHTTGCGPRRPILRSLIAYAAAFAPAFPYSSPAVLRRPQSADARLSGGGSGIIENCSLGVVRGKTRDA